MYAPVRMTPAGTGGRRGLREMGQRRGGAYEASKSKTFPVPATDLFRAFVDDDRRRQWLDVKLVIRRTKPPKSVRITWPDGTNVDVWITPRSDGRAVAAVTLGKLASKEAVADAKQYWSGRLEALAAVFDEGG